MEVKRLSKTLGIEEKKVIGKAEEFARLCAVKRPLGLLSKCYAYLCGRLRFVKPQYALNLPAQSTEVNLIGIAQYN